MKRQTLLQRTLLKRLCGREVLACGHVRGNLPPKRVGNFIVCCEGCARVVEQQTQQELERRAYYAGHVH